MLDSSPSLSLSCEYVLTRSSMKISSLLPASLAVYSRSTLACYTSPYNTRHPGSLAPEDQPRRHVECSAAAQGVLDGGSGVFAWGPNQYQCHLASPCQEHTHETHVFSRPCPRVKMKICPQEVPKRPPPLWALIYIYQHKPDTSIDAHTL